MFHFFPSQPLGDTLQSPLAALIHTLTNHHILFAKTTRAFIVLCQYNLFSNRNPTPFLEPTAAKTQTHAIRYTYYIP